MLLLIHLDEVFILLSRLDGVLQGLPLQDLIEIHLSLRFLRIQAHLVELAAEKLLLAANCGFLLLRERDLHTEPGIVRFCLEDQVELLEPLAGLSFAEVRTPILLVRGENGETRWSNERPGRIEFCDGCKVLAYMDDQIVWNFIVKFEDHGSNLFIWVDERRDRNPANNLDRRPRL